MWSDEAHKRSLDQITKAELSADLPVAAELFLLTQAQHAVVTGHTLRGST
jgi:hypothetical protein